MRFCSVALISASVHGNCHALSGCVKDSMSVAGDELRSSFWDHDWFLVINVAFNLLLLQTLLVRLLVCPSSVSGPFHAQCQD